VLAVEWVAAGSGNGGALQGELGTFTEHGDVGTVLHPGSVEFDAAGGTYTIAGSGENMWLSNDAYQFVWKKMSGDVSLSADIRFIGTGGNPHRKAVLMIRQSLDADSVYADIARHGNGMTALQFRTEAGGLTTEVQSPNWGPQHLRIEKHGAYFTMWLAAAEGKLEVAAGSPRIELKEPFYVGIGVCSHDKDVVEKAVFSNVQVASPQVAAAGTERDSQLYSFLESMPVESTARTAVYVSAGRFEAPNWTRDGKEFLFNRDGRILRLPVGGGKPEALDTGFAVRCNNDHGISPDSSQLAISDQSQGDRKSSSTRFLSPAGRPNGSRRRGRPTGTAGRRTARRSPIALSAATNSTSTPCPRKAARKRGSPPRPASMTDRIIRRTANLFISIPIAPAGCRSGG